jgi:hypothetical protein
MGVLLTPIIIQQALGSSAPEIRQLFLKPDVTGDYAIHFWPPDLDGIVRLLCDEREFSRERVTAALERTYAK